MLVTLFTGCRDPLAPEHDALAAARARWEARGPSSYLYEYRNVCYCLWAQVRVTVSEGAVASVEWLAGEPGSESSAPEGYTVEELFARIEAALDGKPHRADAEYDPVLGYPLAASFDPDQHVVDEQWGFVVEEFQPVD